MKLRVFCQEKIVQYYKMGILVIFEHLDETYLKCLRKLNIGTYTALLELEVKFWFLGKFSLNWLPNFPKEIWLILKKNYITCFLSCGVDLRAQIFSTLFLPNQTLVYWHKECMYQFSAFKIRFYQNVPKSLDYPYKA